MNILASRDTREYSSETEQGHITAQMTVYGASGGASINADFNRSKNGESSTTINNSTLNADTINITTTDDTNIRGGNVHADTELNANIGGDLNVESLQDRHRTKNNAMGISAGVSFGGDGSKAGIQGLGNIGDASGVNGGISASNGMSITKETVLSSLTSGGTATINVAGNTQITGALIATIDEQGNDLNQLTLNTGSLNFTDLTNIHQSNQTSGSISTNIGISGKTGTDAAQQIPTAKDGEGRELRANTTNITYSNTSQYDAEKSLATLGGGNINVGGVQLEVNGELTEAGKADGSALDRLNRDTANLTKELWSVERTEGNIDLQIDHRMFSEEGRKEIAEDVKRTELLGNAVLDVATKDSVTLKDTVQHIGDLQRDLDVQKILATENGGIAATILNNMDTASPEQKQWALNAYAHAYASVYSVTIEEALLIASNSIIKGAHYSFDQEKSYIYINDNQQGNALEFMSTLVHEITHAQTTQGTIRDRGELTEEYAQLRGEYTSGNYNFSFSNSGLGSVNTGQINTHLGISESSFVKDNSIHFGRNAINDPDNMDFAFYGFDGTNQNKDNLKNQSPSNVARMYELYEGDNKFYMPGVGTEPGIQGLLGGISGKGGDAISESMYQHLVNTFNGVDSNGNPLAGGADTAVDIVGGSRGAALGRNFPHYVEERGIPDFTSAREIEVYDTFIVYSPHGLPVDTNIINPDSVRTEIVYDNYLVKPGDSLDVRFVGVFDTVGSFGMPGDNVDPGKNFSITPGSQTVSHAISAFENRYDFGLHSIIDPKNPNDTRLSEQVFSGVHGDVLSMYPNNLIANDALYWMVTEGQKGGVPFSLPVGNDLPFGSNNINRHSHNELTNNTGWQLRQWSEASTVAEPRKVYYPENLPSPYDLNNKNSGGNVIDKGNMTTHLELLNQIKPGSNKPLIYDSKDGLPVRSKTMDEMLNLIF